MSLADFFEQRHGRLANPLIGISIDAAFGLWHQVSLLSHGPILRLGNSDLYIFEFSRSRREPLPSTARNMGPADQNSDWPRCILDMQNLSLNSLLNKLATRAGRLAAQGYYLLFMIWNTSESITRTNAKVTKANASRLL